MLQLTDHFCERWREHFGGPPPSAERIAEICKDAVWLQRCKVLYDKDGAQFKNLGMYWDTKRNVIIKVDWDTNKVVTVITPDRKNRARVREACPEKS